MNCYGKIISAALVHKDPETVTLVEQLIRDETGGALDHLTAGQLAAAARSAEQDVAEFHRSGWLETICAASRLQLPPWAA